MSEIIDIEGRPIAGLDMAKVGEEFEHDLQALLMKYNGRITPAYAVGFLTWMATNIVMSTAAQNAMQNAMLAQKMHEAASKIPMQ